MKAIGHGNEVEILIAAQQRIIGELGSRVQIASFVYFALFLGDRNSHEPMRLIRTVCVVSNDYA